MTVTEALQHRRATPSFDTTVKIDQAELEALIDKACLAPSSMNLQPWEFLVCIDEADKERLLGVAMNQKKVVEASAVIVVVCDTTYHLHAADVADSQIERGYMPAERKEGFVTMVHGFGENKQASREEAIRSSNLWAMAFMLAAAEAGWDTAPMGGFVASDLSTEFGLPETYFPVLLIAIGKRNPSVNLLPRNFRYGAETLTHYGNW